MEAKESLAHALDRHLRRHSLQHGIVIENRELGHGGHDTLGPHVNRRPKLTIVAPSASPEEAAAVVAALERYMRDTAPPPVATPAPRSPWQRAALWEGVDRAPGEPPRWG
jgi:hypothetical protein